MTSVCFYLNVLCVSSNRWPQSPVLPPARKGSQKARGIQWALREVPGLGRVVQAEGTAYTQVSEVKGTRWVCRLL